MPTQGNAGDSLVRYALASDLSVAVAMPASTPLPILGSVAAAALQHPQRIVLELAGRRSARPVHSQNSIYLPQGYFSVTTFQEPGWRIEGKKTLGLELAEPVSGDTRWSVPDAVIYPTGGGTGVLGMWKAWDELQQLGLLDARRPRMYCIQSEATCPLVRAFEQGAADTTPVDGGDTLATGLNVPGGVGHARVLQIVRASGGAALAVSRPTSPRIRSASWRTRHDWIGTEGAACFAALPQLLQRGLLRAGERVVIVNTGSVEKYLPAVRELLQ